jgi:hypothetical protein
MTYLSCILPLLALLFHGAALVLAVGLAVHLRHVRHLLSSLHVVEQLGKVQPFWSTNRVAIFLFPSGLATRKTAGMIG